MTMHATGPVIRLFEQISRSVEAEKDELCALDGAIGDADHGITMAVGFRSVVAALSRLDPAGTPSDAFRAAGAAFLDAAGASTGPLYASGFLRAAQRIEGAVDLNLPAQAEVLDAIGAGIRDRGKGQRGDKTMLDVWLPAADAARTALRNGADAAGFWSEVIAAARAGADATRSMVASRGRAARLGERSLGHLDPGAASAVLILLAMEQAFLSAD